MKREYEGHESWSAWNVALHINNDYLLYQLALDCIAETRAGSASPARKVYRAALLFRGRVGHARTPDGALWSQRSVRLALQDMINEDALQASLRGAA